MQLYAMYLRKSRADLDAEARGEGETLARHRRALTELAERRGLHVARVYEEVVSADSLGDRPQMQALLAAIERGEYAGVIVNDADRLARGDSIDQGVIKRAFYSTGTLIITPIKTYDPSNAADEDFFDFSLFMARFEYKIIKRRLQTGRMRSAAEGNYLGTRITYGYKKVRRMDRSGWTLEPDPEAAEIVRMIFDWYANGDIGANIIANRLNDMGLRTSLGTLWSASTIRHMLKNPCYIGQVSWNKKIQTNKIVGGKAEKKRMVNPEPIIVENAHPAIVDRALWDKVQRMFAGHAKLPKKKGMPVSNVLAGLIYCAHCGMALQRKPGIDGRPDVLHCRTYNCPTTGIYIPTLENILLETLKEWNLRYSAPDNPATTLAEESVSVRAAGRQIATLDKQLDSLHDLLEQGVYTVSDFVRRRNDLQSRKAAAIAQLESAKNTPSTEEQIRAELPQIRKVLDAYPLTDDLTNKNKLLRSVISRVEYNKTHRCFRNENPADFLEIKVFPSKSIF